MQTFGKEHFRCENSMYKCPEAGACLVFCIEATAEWIGVEVRSGQFIDPQPQPLKCKGPSPHFLVNEGANRLGNWLFLGLGAIRERIKAFGTGMVAVRAPWQLCPLCSVCSASSGAPPRMSWWSHCGYAFHPVFLRFCPCSESSSPTFLSSMN